MGENALKSMCIYILKINGNLYVTVLLHGTVTNKLRNSQRIHALDENVSNTVNRM